MELIQVRSRNFLKANLFTERSKKQEGCRRDATAKTPAKYFAAIPKKDAFRNFECGYLQSNHRKVTECGLFGALKRQVAILAVASGEPAGGLFRSGS